MKQPGNKTPIADLSVEIGHLYLSDLKSDAILPSMVSNGASVNERQPEETESGVQDLEDYVTRRLDRGLAAVSPIVARYRASKKRVSTVVLIDDYFYSGSSDVELLDGVVAVTREYAQTVSSDIELDFIAFEADLAESVRTLYNLIVREPNEGAGSRSQSELEYDDRWLGNGQMGRGQSVKKSRRLGRVESSLPQESTAGSNRRQHSIAMDVELLSIRDGTEFWSCPLLAAWWQLVRLGVLRDDSDRPSIPRRTIALRGETSEPLYAKRTLTALVPEFLEVESAVQVILRQTALPLNLRSQLKDSRREVNPRDHLKRMSYVFIDDFFHPIGLRQASDWRRG